MNDNLDLSIVIVNYNTPEHTRDAVESCLKAQSGLDIEVIVADNNSNERLPEKLTEEDGVKIIYQPVNSGFASAVNAGVKRSCGKYCLLLNSDAKIIDGALHKMINCLDVLDKAAAVGGRIKDDDDLSEVSYGFFPNLFVEFRLKLYKMMLERLNFVRSRFEKKMAREKKVEWITGAFMLLRKDLFDKIGGFDEGYFLYFEDIDFCKRLTNEGYYVYYLPSAECTHERGTSMKQLTPKKALSIKRESQRRYYSKHNNFLSNFFLKWATFRR